MDERERPTLPIQRDWLGYVIQLLGVFSVLGLPLVIWGSYINTSIATAQVALARQEKDILEHRQAQVIVSNQLLEINRQLTRIDTQLGDLRESRSRR